MNDRRKTKAQLIDELQSLRAEVAILRQTYHLDSQASELGKQSPSLVEQLQTQLAEQRQVEIALQKNQAMLQAVLDNSGTIAYVKNIHGHYLLVNRQYELLTHHNSSEVLGKTDFDLFPQEAAQRFWESDRQVLQTQATVSLEEALALTNGTRYYFTVRFPVYTADGDLFAVCGVSTDITERKQAALALTRSEQQFRAIFETELACVKIVTADGCLQTMNPAGLAMIEADCLEQVVGQSMCSLIDPNYRQAFLAFVQQAAQGKPGILEFEIVGLQGTRRWMKSHAVPLPMPDESTPLVLAVTQEISDRRQAERILQQFNTELEQRITERTVELAQANDRLQRELFHRAQIEQALQESELKFHAAFDQSFLFMGLLEPNGTIFEVNQRSKELTAITGEEFVGRPFWDLSIWGQQQSQMKEMVERALAGEVVCFEMDIHTLNDSLLQRPDGSLVTHDVRVKAIKNVAGQVMFLMVEGWDISERKRVENERKHVENERKQAEANLRESEAALRELYDITAALDLSFEKRFQRLLNLGCRQFDLDYSFLATIQDYHYEVVSVQTPDGSVIPGNIFDVRQAYCLETLNSDDPICIESASQSEWCEHPGYAGFGMESYIGMRVQVAGKVFGVLCFCSRNPARKPFSAVHRQILKLMCQWIGREIERQQAVLALQQSEEKFRLLAENSTDLISRHSIDGIYLYASPACLLLLGYAPEALIGHSIDEFLHPEDLGQIRQIHTNLLKTPTISTTSYRIRRQDGAYVWFETNSRLIHDPETQEVLEIHSSSRDITFRKQVEATLRESDRRWRSLLDNVQLVVVGLDHKGNVEYINPYFLELTQFTSEEALGKNWMEHFIPVRQRTILRTSFQEVIEKNFHDHYQNSILTKSGEERLIAWNNTVLRDGDGNTIGTISIGEDITERDQLERMKGEFISMVSHELRTPLTSMQAALSLLVDNIIDPTSEEGKDVIQIASTGVDRLVRLVNDILDLERLESGKVRLTKHPCNIADLATGAVEQMQEMANQAGVVLNVSADPFAVDADNDRLLQVIINLLSNAIKFSLSGGTVTLTVTSRNNHLLFAVTDEGRGIPADKLESIFERFHQVDASDSRNRGGTGLGLAICRSIIQQHNGRIWAESSSKGSTFYFTLPLEEQ